MWPCAFARSHIILGGVALQAAIGCVSCTAGISVQVNLSMRSHGGSDGWCGIGFHCGFKSDYGVVWGGCLVEVGEGYEYEWDVPFRVGEGEGALRWRV